MFKMLVTLIMTMTNNKKQPTLNCQKQSQTKPILSLRDKWKNAVRHGCAANPNAVRHGLRHEPNFTGLCR